MNSKDAFVSVITPVLNGREYLKRSLQAVKSSDYPLFELIVVDDNSQDGSGDVARSYADIIITNKSSLGPAQARNIAIEKSRGELLFFLDADVVIRPDTISKAARAFNEDRSLSAAFGSYDDRPPANNFFSQYKNLFNHFIHQNSSQEASTFWAGCGIVKKSDFTRVGGFSKQYPSSSIEDVELGYRLKAAGKKIRLLKDLQVTHLKNWSFLTLIKTDILRRAIPWSKLSFEKGLSLDLNFKLKDRLSGILSCTLFLLLILSLYRAVFILPFMAVLSALTFLNIRLYSFFFQKKGLIFAIAAAAFHWFYLFYSSFVFTAIYAACSLRKVFTGKTTGR